MRGRKRKNKRKRKKKKRKKKKKRTNSLMDVLECASVIHPSFTSFPFPSPSPYPLLFPSSFPSPRGLDTWRNNDVT